MRLCIAAVVMAGCVGEIDSGDPAFDEEAGDDPDSSTDVLAGRADGLADPDADVDRDGIADGLEERLLRRYRPFYRFTANESFGPANPIAELTSSQLKIVNPDTGTSDPICGRDGDHHLDPPDALYTCRPDANLATTGTRGNYCLNLDNDRYHGVPIADAKTKGTGLYGHVAPTTVDGHAAYKIEYWQFFAFNNQDISLLGLGSFADHEGDWTSVQLWFDRELHRLVRVRYLVHGKTFTFAMAAMTPTCTDCTIDMTGSGFNPNPPNLLDKPAAYENNAAQFYVDANKYKHVVVYIERGGHEMWPGAWGHAETSFGPKTFHLNSHAGDGPGYLVPAVTDRVLNLGELEHPLTREARLIMSFDGLWGCTNTQEILGTFGPRRRSPVGPALHCSWTYPDGRKLAGCEN